jgi:hypothetical protein
MPERYHQATFIPKCRSCNPRVAAIRDGRVVTTTELTASWITNRVDNGRPLFRGLELGMSQAAVEALEGRGERFDEYLTVEAKLAEVVKQRLECTLEADALTSVNYTLVAETEEEVARTAHDALVERWTGTLGRGTREGNFTQWVVPGSRPSRLAIRCSNVRDHRKRPTARWELHVVLDPNAHVVALGRKRPK